MQEKNLNPRLKFTRPGCERYREFLEEETGDLPPEMVKDDVVEGVSIMRSSLAFKTNACTQKSALSHFNLCFIVGYPVEIIPDVIRIDQWLGRNHKRRHIQCSI